jgi:protein-tyrosine phosphatase
MANVLFVCLGNICRSPAAHGVFEHMIKAEGLEQRIIVDSCGTGSWHIGQAPDDRMIKTAKKKGYDLSSLRARRISSEDFERFDYILAMDARNLADAMKLAPNHYSGRLQLFLDFATEKNLLEVPDPYYGGAEGFERVLALVESTSKNLLAEIKKTL